MSTRRDLRTYAAGLPQLRCEDKHQVDRLVSKTFLTRIISSSDEVAEIAKIVGPPGSQSRNDHNFCIIPARNKPRGIYIDSDVKIQTTAPILSLQSARENLDAVLKRFIKVYVELFVTELIRTHLNDAGMLSSKRNAELYNKLFRMLYCPRPELGEPTITDGNYCYKYGVHAYIGEIQAKIEDQVSACKNALSALRNPHYESMINEILAVTHTTKEKLFEDVIDISPIASGNYLIPFNRKAGGTITYTPKSIIEYKITGHGNAVIAIENKEEVYNSQALLPYFPIHSPNVIDLSCHEATKPVNLPDLDIESDITDDLRSFPEKAINEAREFCPKVANLIELLQILPFNPYATSHDERIKIYAVVAHELSGNDISAEASERWCNNIMYWFICREENSPTQTRGHIMDKVDEARANPFSGINMGWLERECAKYNQERTAALIKSHQCGKLWRLLVRYFRDIRRRDNFSYEHPLSQLEMSEIGRASCRERV